MRGLPWWLTGKNLPGNAGDAGLIPGSRRPPEEGNGNLLQEPCLGKPMDRGARRAIVHAVAKSQTRLSDETTTKEKREKTGRDGSDWVLGGGRGSYAGRPTPALSCSVKGL